VRWRIFPNRSALTDVIASLAKLGGFFVASVGAVNAREDEALAFVLNLEEAHARRVEVPVVDFGTGQRQPGTGEPCAWKGSVQSRV